MIIGTPDGRYYIRSWYVVFRELTEEESKITPIFIY